ncbi:MAG: hypothetical protein U9O64_02450 [Campylobacterota bacterium]|nr:hypothetical protein [Campylobacterota bacterium]
MFVAITGEPGSGKSAYAVDYIITHKEEYQNVYVNINGFKMHDNIQPLNFPSLIDILTNCKYIYDTQIAELGNAGNENSIDEPIVEYLKDIGFIEKNPKYELYKTAHEERKKETTLKKTLLNIFKPIKKEPEFLPTLFVIDEVQNHMGAIDPNTGKEQKTADPILTWWVSYHRHLFMDVLILSQQYQKIHIAYRRDIAYFLDAIESQSLVLGKGSPNFVYNKHKDSPYSKKNNAGKVRVKKRAALFEAYQSGDAVRSKSVIVPYIMYAIGFFILAYLAFLNVVSGLESDSNENNITTQTTQAINTIRRINHNESYVLSDKLFYIKLKCISDICKNPTYKIDINIADLNETVTTTQSKILSIKTFSPELGEVSLLASTQFLILFQGATNENKKNNNSFNLLK